MLFRMLVRMLFLPIRYLLVALVVSGDVPPSPGVPWNWWNLQRCGDHVIILWWSTVVICECSSEACQCHKTALWWPLLNLQKWKSLKVGFLFLFSKLKSTLRSEYNFPLRPMCNDLISLRYLHTNNMFRSHNSAGLYLFVHHVFLETLRSSTNTLWGPVAAHTFWFQAMDGH